MKKKQFGSPGLALMALTTKQKLETGRKVDFVSVIALIDEMVATLKQQKSHDESSRDMCTVNLANSDLSREENLK